MKRLFNDNMSMEEIRSMLLGIRRRNNIAFVVMLVLGIIATTVFLTMLIIKMMSKCRCNDDDDFDFYDEYDDDDDFYETCEDGDCCATDEDFEKN